MKRGTDMSNESFLTIYKEFTNIPQNLIASSDELSELSLIIEIGKTEFNMGICGFFAGNPTIETMIKKSNQLKYAIRRVEYNLPKNISNQIIDIILNRDDGIIITPYAIVIIILRCCLNRIDLVNNLVDLFNEANLPEYSEVLLQNKKIFEESEIQCIHIK